MTEEVAKHLSEETDTAPDKPTGRIRFTIGETIELSGIQLRLAYVNPGRKRLTFEIVDPSIKLAEPERNPIVSVTR